jgi:hypothetical protein
MINKPSQKPEAEVKVESFEHEEDIKVNPDFNPFKSIVEEKPPIKPEE